jgi:tRNA(Ile)-lysidine synthase
MPDLLVQTLIENPDLQQASNIVVGYSAGLDSTALLCAIAQAFPLKPKVALHVHHGLQTQADAWIAEGQANVSRINQQLALSGAHAIVFEVHRVKVDIAHQGLEAAARTARYAVFERSLNRANSLLVLAHHANDQVETFWLRVLRGTGIKGLQGMPQSRSLGQGRLLRPWLTFSRKQLEQFAHVHGLRWIEDPSNTLLDFDRNWLRHSVLPEVYQRKPDAHTRFTAVCEQVKKAQSILNEVLAEDWQRCISATDTSVDLSALARLSAARQQQLLAAWLEQHLHKVPEYQWIDRLQQEVILAKPDRQPLLRLGQYDIRRFKQRLYALPSLASQIQQNVIGKNDHQDKQMNETRSWSVVDYIKLEPGFNTQIDWPLGQLQIQVVNGRGLSLHSLHSLQWVLRPSGARLQLPNQRHSASLKHWLHKEAIMPWLRPWVPCLMQEGQVIDIAGCLAEKQPQIGDNDLGLVWEWLLPAPYALRPSTYNRLNALEIK